MGKTPRAGDGRASPRTALSDTDAAGPLAGAPPRRAFVEEAVDPPPPEGRWSARRTLLFIVAVCGVFWLILGVALWHLLT